MVFHSGANADRKAHRGLRLKGRGETCGDLRGNLRNKTHLS